MMNRFVSIAIQVFGAAVLLAGGPAAAYHLCEVDDAALVTTYLGNHPKDKSPGWHEGMQGFTHGRNGDNAWYITQQDKGIIHETKNRLWRVPFSHNLASDVYEYILNPGGGVTRILKAGVSFVDHRDIPALEHYDHFGDPDYFDPDNDGNGYVFVPIEGPGVPGAVAVFSAPSLEYLYKRSVQSGLVKHAPLVAFDSAGYLYTSQGESSHHAENVDPKRLSKWTVDWDLLASGPRPGDARVLDKTGEVTLLSTPVVEAVCDGDPLLTGGLSCDETIPVGDRNGGLVGVGLLTPQGVEFSDDDQLMYIANGKDRPLTGCIYRGLLDADDSDSSVLRHGCGVHGFVVRSSVVEGAPCSADPGSCFAVRLNRSSNSGDPLNEDGPFNYGYEPGWPKYEEPEGLDWFDLDSEGAPDIPGFTSGTCTDPVSGATLDPCPVIGQLHVSLLNVEFPAPFVSDGSDGIYIKHYRVHHECPPQTHPDIAVTPLGIDFGDVPVAGDASALVSLENEGDGELTISSIGLAQASDPGFRLSSVPALPLTVEPAGIDGFSVIFAPETEGEIAATVEVESNDPDEPIVTVTVTARAIGFPEQARNLINLFDSGIETGNLVGSGPGISASGRAGALRNKLVRAWEEIEADNVTEGCSVLRSAYDRTDGAPKPPEFIAGPATVTLAAEITALRDRLGCVD